MSVGSGDKLKMCPKHQADAVLDQNNPVSGTKYVVLDTTKNVRIIGIEVHVTWTGQPTPLECHITIDGQSYTASFTDPVSNTLYHVGSSGSTSGFVFSSSDLQNSRAFLLEGRSVKVEVETTGGTVSSLKARVKYAKW